MKFVSKLAGIVSLLCIILTTPVVAEVNNSSIDLKYKGSQILTNYYVSNAYKPVKKLDDGKIALEQRLASEILSQPAVTSVSYVDLTGNQTLDFYGQSDGVVSIQFSGFGIETRGRGKDSGIKFDWELAVTDLSLYAEYNYMTGDLSNLQLHENYNVNFDFDAGGIAGFFIDVVKLLGFDAEDYISSKVRNMITDDLGSMFEQKFNNYSTSLFALDKVIPAEIYYQGKNISPIIKSYLTKPLNGKFVRISTDLETSTNQSITINLWDDIVLTARRIKPVINSASSEYLACEGLKRRVGISWGYAGSDAYYYLEKKSGSSWESVYSGKKQYVFSVSETGSISYRVRAKRQRVMGEWYNIGVRIPSCSSTRPPILPL